MEECGRRYGTRNWESTSGSSDDPFRQIQSMALIKIDEDEEKTGKKSTWWK